MGTQLPPQKGGTVPQFSAHLYCGQWARCIKMPLGMEVGLDPDHIVLLLWGPSSPKKGAQPPQFSAHLYCGQTAGCIKMPLGMEVGLGPGHTVIDGDPASLPKRGAAPNFRPTSIVAKRLHGMNQDATCYGDRPRLTRHCVRWGASPLP